MSLPLSLAAMVYATVLISAPWVSLLVLVRLHPDTNPAASTAGPSTSAPPLRTAGTVQDDIIDLISKARHQPLNDAVRQSARALLMELQRH
ncbi:hypothetical protein [Rhodococcus aetherivorans]|uniref:hypothetical protein n=1 Tax=Rhodococcus aetherivorans TaxID=191292 RepID=UPI003EB922D4